VKKILTLLCIPVMVLSLTSDVLAKDKKPSVRTPLGASVNWQAKIVRYSNFTDLGNYVLELPDFTDPASLERGRILAAEAVDHGDITKLGCTAMVARNKKGEVVFGRNMDMEVSQKPGYVYRSTFGKYKNISVTYMPGFYIKYDEILKNGKIEQEFLDRAPMEATDSFNEKGLYIECNMRSGYPEITNYGLHSAHGETHRADGVAWKDLRMCVLSLPYVVTQNCATVKEAIDYIKNSYDWYTISKPGIQEDGWNLTFLIGDATGEYGLLEIAQDEVSYIPYQYGQANYYITPKWNVFDTRGCGQGRLAGVAKQVNTFQTATEAMDAMKAIMWRNETLWVGESYRADKNKYQNPYNQIIFQDDKGNPQLDWRSDYVNSWPILKDGRLLASKKIYDEACSSTYDPQIKKYFNDAVASGRLVVDDGTIRFTVKGKKVTLDQLEEKYEACCMAMLYNDEQKQQQLMPYYEKYKQMINSQDLCWTLNDRNFEALKAMVYAKLHIRYDENGKFDTKALSKYEKLKMFYGYGTAKNETPLRDDGAIWTTGLNVGVNCARKEMKVRFWENDDVVYSFKW